MPKSRSSHHQREEGGSAADKMALEAPPHVVSARTLRLFTTAASSDVDFEESRDATTASTKKNPRWLESQEKTAKSDAIRDKILSLIADIEAEEERDEPVMKKAWLHAKKLELMRISLKQPEEIIARERFFRQARRKLREAQRSRRNSGSQQEDSSVDDNAEREGGGSGADDGAASKTRKASRGWTISTVTDAAQAVAATSMDRSDDEASKSDGVFNLSPTGRVSRPNPRAKHLELTDDSSQESKKLPKPLEKLNKIVRFPMESGFKLGRMIRSRRDKAAARRRREGSGGDDSGGEDGSTTWGKPVRSVSSRSGSADEPVKNGSRSSQSRSTQSRSSSNSNSRDHSSGGSSSSSIADIPVLQEASSVAKRFREKLTIRRKPKAAADDDTGNLSGDSGNYRDADGADSLDSAKVKKKKKDKTKSEKQKKPQKSSKKSEPQKSVKESAPKDSSANAGAAALATGRSRARSFPSEPVQFVELEDGVD